MWNRFKKSLRGGANTKPVATELDSLNGGDSPSISSQHYDDGDVTFSEPERISNNLGDPKQKVKRKLTLFGNHSSSNAEKSKHQNSEMNVSAISVKSENGERRNQDKQHCPMENGKKATNNNRLTDDKRSNGTSAAVKRSASRSTADKDPRVVSSTGSNVDAEKRQSGLSNVSCGSSTTTGSSLFPVEELGPAATTAAIAVARKAVIGGARIDVPVSVDVDDDDDDDDDEVFHRRPVGTTLTTFAATADVRVTAKQSPPKMKRRTKTSNSSTGSNETESRRSKLTKASIQRSGVTAEPVPIPTVPTAATTSSVVSKSESNKTQQAAVRSPPPPPPTATTSSASVTLSPASTATSAVKRVPPPVPVRRSSTRNGGPDVISPSRDPVPPALVNAQAGGSVVSPPPPPTLKLTGNSGCSQLRSTLYCGGGGQPKGSISSTRSSPGDSGSDDTEGKESGYVTLDDLQAQLVCRSSWSSDDRDIGVDPVTSSSVTSKKPLTVGRLLRETVNELTDLENASRSDSTTIAADSLTASQTSTSTSCPTSFTVEDMTDHVDDVGNDDDSLSWPAPPSPLHGQGQGPTAASALPTLEPVPDPIISAKTSSADTNSANALVAVVSSTQRDPVPVDVQSPPVVTFTFTVKLDGSDLLTNRVIAATATETPAIAIASASAADTITISDRQHRAAVGSFDIRPVITQPDVVVCAGACNGNSTSVSTSGFELSSAQQISMTATAAAARVVTVKDGRLESDGQQNKGREREDKGSGKAVSVSAEVTSTTMKALALEKESRSCQTETSAGFCSKCIVCPHTKNDIDDRTRSELESGADMHGSDQCHCQCKMDEGSYLRPLVSRVYTNRSPTASSSNASVASPTRRCYHSSTSVAASSETVPTSPASSITVRAEVEEATHMSWGEVLEEAETMGIQLNPPPGATYAGAGRQNDCGAAEFVVNSMMRSPSRISCSSSAVDATSLCRTPTATNHRRHYFPPDIIIDDRISIDEQCANVSVVNLAEDGRSADKKTSKSGSTFRDFFRWFSSRSNTKKNGAPSTPTVRRSKSLEQPYRIQSRGLPGPPPKSSLSNNKSKRMTVTCSDSTSTGSDRNRLMRASSRHSALSCPSSSAVHTHHMTATRTARAAPPSRSISVASSGQCSSSATDYFVGSTCSGGSLPAFHKRRIMSSSSGVGVDQLMTLSFESGSVMVDDPCCTSPSVNSSTCSRSVSYRCHASASTPQSPTGGPSSTAAGLFSSLSMRCATLKNGTKTDFVNSLSELQNYGWYWGALGFDEAEAKLANRRDGSFLVRDSSDERYILSLSFRSLGGTHHTRIEHYKGSFSFCSQSPPTAAVSNLAPSSSIVEFIEGAMAASRAGQCLYYLRPRAPGLAPAPVRLLYPVSRFRCMHSLQHLCKFAVLRHVRLDMVDRLPVPPRLKEYLKHGRPTVE